MEINQSFFKSKKTGKKRSKTAVIASIVLFSLAAVFIIGGIFLVMSLMLSPLIFIGKSWLYFLVMIIASAALGTFGSVFSTYSSLYQAKDNDLLLSLPIPLHYILLTRLAGVYMTSLMYSMLVLIPAIIVYWLKSNITFAVVAGPIIFALDVSFFIFALSCALGWVVASISSKLKNRSIATVLISLLFLGAYYVLYFRASELVTALIANSSAISSAIMTRARALYFVGIAAAGDMKALAIVTLADVALLAAALYIISKTFTAFATSSGGSSRRAYKEKTSKVKNVHAALLQKEFRRFASSSTYMLNCAMGTVFMLIAAVGCLIKGNDAMLAASQFGFQGEQLTVIAVIAICSMMSANNISAPSISMEGRNLWIIRSLPIKTQDIFRAKLRMHIIITDIPALLCSACVFSLIRPGAAAAIISIAAIIAYGALSAAFGLIMNIKDPNMSWISETAAVKQNFSVAAVIFGGWIVMAVIAICYVLMHDIIPPAAYLTICAALFAACAAALYRWIMTSGSAEFEKI